MNALKQDLSVFKRFNFERSPVGVKFLLRKPEGIRQLDQQMALCQMLNYAQQQSAPFFITKDNENCFGKMALGMEAPPAFAEAGLIGEALEIFQDPRANSRLYQYIPTLSPETVKYVAFSSLDNLNFDPDLMIIVGTPEQAEIILRAMTYSTGELWEPKGTPIIGCAWLYIHPYKSGKVNYTVTGLAFGMKAKEVFPAGLMIISIPYNWIPTIIQNLEEMKWVLPSYTDGKEKFDAREKSILENLAKETID